MEQIKEQEMVPYVGDFCPYIEEDEPTEDYKVETVNVAFQPKCIIDI